MKYCVNLRAIGLVARTIFVAIAINSLNTERHIVVISSILALVL